ncbi:hypothetical protein TRM7557_03086 [Tritonibacter multivorans]|uniref:DUF115 domain-containing protein n=3 Tax=Tritonibacter multivorans TaxID=928856 RepID=A0A0P1GGR4_9RHOB|nr:hypothetical protein TRM7557_03086 [Tritonibacter multivorans]SFD55901.1 hypothetical protein SAMN04488049_11635 [Tritonibacter multivorans]
MQSDDKLSSLMKDIVRYERTIGELLDKNDALSGEVALHAKEREAWFANRQDGINSELSSLTNMVLRLSEQQGRQFDMVYRLLAQSMIGQGDRKSDTGGTTDLLLNHAMDRSAAFADTIGRIVTGRTVERTAKHRVELAEDSSIRALRGKLVQDANIATGGNIALVLEENGETGVHSLIFPVAEVSATGFRGVTLEVKPLETRALRVRIRQSDDWRNNSEVNIDLKTLRHANFETTFALGRREVAVTNLREGWVRIKIETGLEMSDAPIELELIAMGNVTARSSKRKGSGRAAFAIKTCDLLRSDGLTSSQTDEVVQEEMNDVKRTAPAIMKVDINTPSQERKRREKREAYLASGAYRKLTRFRNMHAGKRAFIIGNGPSINKQDLTLLKDEVTFVTNWFINHPQYNEIDPSYFCVSSHEMFGGWGTPEPKANQDWLQGMLARAGNAHKFFSYPFRDFLIGDGVFPEDQCDFLLFDRPKYQVDQRGDINLDLTQPMDDGYTGIVTFCLPLAHFMGITEIYLIGCDCDYGLTTPDAPKSYFYDFSKHTTKTTSHEGLTRVWAENGPVFQTYEVVRNRFLQDGIQIVNCTDGGRLEVFPRARYEDVVASKA